MIAQGVNSYRLTNPILGNLRNLSGADFFAKLIPAIINLVLVVGAVVFMLVLFWGAISWITSGGDKTAIESARGRVIAAIVGLAILFSVWAIIRLLETFFGINILTLDILGLSIR